MASIGTSSDRRSSLFAAVLVATLLLAIAAYYGLSEPGGDEAGSDRSRAPGQRSRADESSPKRHAISHSEGRISEEAILQRGSSETISVGATQTTERWDADLQRFLEEGLPGEVENDPFTFEDSVKTRQRHLMQRPGYANWLERELRRMFDGTPPKYETMMRSKIFTPEFLAEMEAHKTQARELQQKYVAALLSGDPQASQFELQVLAMLARGEYPLFPEVRDMLVRAWRSMVGSENTALVDKIARLFAHCDGPESLDFVMAELQSGTDVVKTPALARAMQDIGIFYGSSGMTRGKDKVAALVQIVGEAFVRATEPSTRAAAFGVLAKWAEQVKRDLADLEGRLAWFKQAYSDSMLARADIQADVQRLQDGIARLNGLIEIIKGYL